MIDPERFRERSEALSEALHAKLGVRGRGLEARLRRAGRRLPKQARRAGQEIIAASRRVDHPKLARLDNPARLDAAFDRISADLSGADRGERRRVALLSVLAALVLNLMLLGLGVIVLLRWQGLL